MRILRNTIKPFILCAVCFSLLALFLCACTNATENGSGNDTPGPNVTDGPTDSPTPTFGFRDPTVSDVGGYTETGLPSVNGTPGNSWKLAKEYRLENDVYGDRKPTSALFRVIWGEDCMYVLVHVFDPTPDTSAESVYDRDSVFLFINEDNRKNKVYSVGDACYIVDRDGNGFLGPGAKAEGYQCCAYGDGTDFGYYVEVRIPLLTVTGRLDRQIGFDVRVNNAEEGQLIHMLQWADTGGHTDLTLTGVGTLTMD